MIHLHWLVGVFDKVPSLKIEREFCLTETRGGKIVTVKKRATLRTNRHNTEKSHNTRNETTSFSSTTTTSLLVHRHHWFVSLDCFCFSFCPFLVNTTYNLFCTLLSFLLLLTTTCQFTRYADADVWHSFCLRSQRLLRSWPLYWWIHWHVSV